ELLPDAAAHAIDARVADLRRNAIAARDEQRRNRRRHSLLRRVELGHAEDHVAGALHRALDEAAHRLAPVVAAGLLQELCDERASLTDEAADLLDRFLAGDFTLGVAADAVGDDVQAQGIV